MMTDMDKPKNTPTQAPAIEVTGLNKWFDDFHVLKDIDITVEEKEIIVICGPSGSGKSTFIRCINHLEKYQEGQILYAASTTWKNTRKAKFQFSDSLWKTVKVLQILSEII